MAAVIDHVDDNEEHDHDEEIKNRWIKGKNTPRSTETEDSGKEDRRRNRIYDVFQPKMSCLLSFSGM